MESLLVLLVLTNLFILGSSRLASYVQVLAIQGLILGVVTIGLHEEALSARIIILGLGGALVKSALLPILVFRAINVVHIRKQVEPYVGYTVSVLIGTVMFGLASWLGAKLPLPGHAFSPLVVPVAFFTVFCGLFLIVSRSKAIAQVISYLIIENGIYLFGIAFVGEAPVLAELGILLDVVVGVFVMGIVIHHITREFDSLDVGKLSNLKDTGV
jgi:hydrogenase-4 component E